MPTLTLKFKDKTIRRYHLEKGQTLTIGRRQANDIVIENLAVSGNHAKIDSLETGFLLTDLQSKNGSFVNEQLVSSHYLNHGDTITIGKHNIQFAFGDEEEQPDNFSAGMDQTMVMDTDKHREMMAASKVTAPAAAAAAHSGVEQTGPLAALTFLAGGEGELILSKKLTKLGKNPDSDLIVNGFFVGKNAATISNRPKGYYLSYVGGFAKPKVNDMKVKDSVRLKEFDIIKLGSIKVQFIHH